MTVGVAANGSFRGVLGQHRHDVLIERLARAAGLLAAIENRNRLHGRGQRGQECLAVEGPVQAHLHHANLFALAHERVHGFLGGLGARTHQHDHALCVLRAVVVEEAIAAACQLGKTIHHRLHDAGNGRVERRAGLARLEEHVGILCRAANERAIRRKSVLAEGDQVLVVHQGAKRLVADGLNLAYLVRGAEAVEEMDEGNARLERGDLRHGGKIRHFLHGVRGQHRPSGRAAGHHVAVIAEDRERVRGQSAGRNVHRSRGQLTGNLEHVGNHQQQALRGRKRGAKGPCLQRAVQGAGRAAFTLHLFHDGQCAPDVFLPLREPLIGPLGHR